MNENIRFIIAHNVNRLMEYYGKQRLDGKKMTQTELAQKTGLNQKTIGNLLRLDNVDSITSGTIEAVAKAFKLEPYHLLIPDLPVEELISKRIEKIVKNYAFSSDKARDAVLHVSDAMADYTNHQNNI